MSRLTTIALTLCLLAGFSPLAAAFDFNHDGVVDVFAALGVAETTEMDFGTVSNNDGTVTLGTGDSITANPQLIHVTSSTVFTGDYTISGEANATVAVALTGSATAGLTIDTFTTDQGDLNNVPLGGGGSVVLAIGADLTVDSGTASPGTDLPLNFTLGITYN